MNHVVSPFLEEIIQYIDATLCDDNKEFAELPRDLRVYAALAMLSKAGIATRITKAGQDDSWEPTTSFLPTDIKGSQILRHWSLQVLNLCRTTWCN